MSRLWRVALGLFLAAGLLAIPQVALAAGSLTIGNPPPSPVTPHVPFTHTFSASGGVGPYVFTVDPLGGDITHGLSLATNGVLAGTPDVPGTWIFTVVLKDGNNDTATLLVTMEVSAPIITFGPPPPAQIQAFRDFSHPFIATGGKTPYTFTKLWIGTPPTGIGLSSSGLLQGIPHDTGTFTIKVFVEDAQHFEADDQTFTFEVVPPTIVVSPTPTSPIYTGQAFSHTFTADIAFGTKTFAVQALPLPPGLSLSSAGVVSGTPTTAGSYPLTIRATTAAGGYEYSGFLDFILVVADPAAAFTSGPPPGGVVDTPYSFAFLAGGDSGIAFSHSGGNLPPGLSLAADGVLSGTPTTAGTYAFVVTATGTDTSAEQNATITIAPKPAPTNPTPTNPTPTGPVLAATGPDATAYAVAGVLLIIAGLVVVGFIRRRRAVSSG
jgi:hypothetical protein